MTNGQRLKKILGLENFKTVFITRLITQSTKPIYIVYYDSLRKSTVIPKRKARHMPYVSMTYAGSDLNRDRFEKPVMTPLMDIENWGGNIQVSLITTVDLSYAYHLQSKNFDRLPEKTQSNIVKNSMSLFLPNQLLKEFVTFGDLKDTGNISATTKEFRAERSKIMGQENATAKLLDCINGMSKCFINS